MVRVTRASGLDFIATGWTGIDERPCSAGGPLSVREWRAYTEVVAAPATGPSP